MKSKEKQLELVDLASEARLSLIASVPTAQRKKTARAKRWFEAMRQAVRNAKGA